MGMDPNGILAYGYDLGGPEHWRLNKPEADEYGCLEEDEAFVFMKPFKGAENLDDSWFSERAIDYLLMKSGFKLYQWHDSPGRPVGYGKIEAEAKAGLGIQIVDYGSDGYRGYILCTTSFSSPDYDAMVVEPNLIDHSAADRLYRALEVLEIEPTQAEPRWILASYYG